MDTATSEPENGTCNRPEETSDSMAARKNATPENETLGRRLARLRKEAGCSQRSPAEEIGISNRMVAYYEAQTEHPPAHLLTPIADALSLTLEAPRPLPSQNAKHRRTNVSSDNSVRSRSSPPPRARESVIEHIEGLVAKYGGRQ